MEIVFGHLFEFELCDVSNWRFAHKGQAPLPIASIGGGTSERGQGDTSVLRCYNSVGGDIISPWKGDILTSDGGGGADERRGVD